MKLKCHNNNCLSRGCSWIEAKLIIFPPSFLAAANNRAVMVYTGASAVYVHQFLSTKLFLNVLETYTIFWSKIVTFCLLKKRNCYSYRVAEDYSASYTKSYWIENLIGLSLKFYLDKASANPWLSGNRYLKPKFH